MCLLCLGASLGKATGAHNHLYSRDDPSPDQAWAQLARVLLEADSQLASAGLKAYVEVRRTIMPLMLLL